MDMIERLKRCGKTQSWLILEIRNRYGINVYPHEMSRFIHGTLIGPKAERVLKISDEILSEIDK